MTNNKTVFVSNSSFMDAEFKCKMAGFRPIGRAQNKKGQYVVFGRKGWF